MQITARQLADTLGGTLMGDPEMSASKMSGILHAQPDSISFLSHVKYTQHLADCRASIILLPKHITVSLKPEQAYIGLTDVMSGVQQISTMLAKSSSLPKGISEQCSIDAKANLQNTTCVGHFTIIEAGAAIGHDTQIHAQVYIGHNVIIGNHCIIYPGVKIYHDCTIGDRVIIHSNAVIGSDGFGYTFSAGAYHKIQQLGKVMIEDDVEIGSNTVIDRAAFDATIIRKGVKLDNLIQIAHNVEVGPHTAMAAQSGIAGSTTIGEYCRVGGQVAITGHIKVAEGSEIQGKSGIASDIKEKNRKWYGYPALPVLQYLKSYAIFKKLPEMLKELQDLRKLIENKKGKN